MNTTAKVGIAVSVAAGIAGIAYLAMRKSETPAMSAGSSTGSENLSTSAAKVAEANNRMNQATQSTIDSRVGVSEYSQWFNGLSDSQRAYIRGLSSELRNWYETVDASSRNAALSRAGQTSGRVAEAGVLQEGASLRGMT